MPEHLSCELLAQNSLNWTEMKCNEMKWKSTQNWGGWDRADDLTDHAFLHLSLTRIGLWQTDRSLPVATSWGCHILSHLQTMLTTATDATWGTCCCCCCCCCWWGLATVVDCRLIVTWFGLSENSLDHFQWSLCEANYRLCCSLLTLSLDLSLLSMPISLY